MKDNLRHNAIEPMVRADSWAAKLTPEQQRKLYGKARQSNLTNEERAAKIRELLGV